MSMFPMALRPTEETQANYAVEWLVLAESIGGNKFSAALVQAVRDSDYFPTISKIRQCAGVTQEQQALAGGEAAWLYVLRYIDRYPDWGDLNHCRPPSPRLPERIDHACRCVGGINAIQYAPEQSRQFMKRDFLGAWERYTETAAAYRSLQLEAPIVLQRLEGESRTTPALATKTSWPGSEKSKKSSQSVIAEQGEKAGGGTA